MFSVLLRSGAFWTAVVAVITAIVSYYAQIPKEIWIPVESLLGTTILILFGNETAKTFARERALAESEQREKDIKKQITLEDKG